LRQRQGWLGLPVAQEVWAMTKGRRSMLTGIACGLGLWACMTTAGCQVEVGGQTLPSGYWLSDDVQYYAPGPEFVLSKEAAALKEFQADRAAVEAVE
jgi:hypothetical protein